MKILITGAKGMLAQAVRERFLTAPDGSANELILTDVTVDDADKVASGSNGETSSPNGQTTPAKISRRALDITDAEAVTQLITEVRPDVIINCAAYTNVDGAEQAEALAEKVNAVGPENLAKAAAQVKAQEHDTANEDNSLEVRNQGAILVHISTDYVFGGAKPVQDTDTELTAEPEKYTYSEDDEKNPQSVYGKTKLKGEEAIAANTEKYYIFRTAWLYGRGGKNFVETMIGAAEKQIENRDNLAEKAENSATKVSVVDDQHGSPTLTDDLTDIIYQAVYSQIPFGIYNATNEGFTTWAEFTRKIYELTGIDCEVKGISTAEYEAEATRKAAEKGEKRIVAPRPLNSQMSKDKLRTAGVTVPEWQDALKRYLTETGRVL